MLFHSHTLSWLCIQLACWAVFESAKHFLKYAENCFGIFHFQFTYFAHCGNKWQAARSLNLWPQTSYLITKRKPIFLFPTQAEHLLEEEEEAAADQLHLQALIDVAVEQPQQLGDVRER